MPRALAVVLAALVLSAAGPGSGQQMTMKDLIRIFDQDTTLTLGRSGVTLSTADYLHEGRRVEAITFRPAGEGPFPAVLLIPGYMKTARDYIPTGLTLARAGFASMAVSQPGFGRSEGEPDWVGPRTLATIEAGYERLEREPYVDAARVGVFGYSRGAVASAFLAVRRDDVRAAVAAAGIYDLKRAYETCRIEGIRKNIEIETGLGEEALRERSPLFMMERLRCPVLILHGEKDVNAPVEQAILLRDRLTALGKAFEIRLYADREHDIGRDNLYEGTIDFFDRYLAPEAPDTTSSDRAPLGASPREPSGD